MEDAIRIREQCPYFRILTIGRANAGKTTILKKVCNTTDEPTIYDPQGNQVREALSSRLECSLVFRGQIDLSKVEPSAEVRYRYRIEMRVEC